MFFIAYLFIVVITFIAWYQIKYGRRNRLLAKIPSPKKKLFFNNSLDFVGIDPKRAFEYFAEQSQILGKVYHISMTPFDGGFAIINDVKVAEAILSSQSILDKTVDYDLFKPWIGTGLIVASGNKWFKRRKLLTPGFHFQILERFAEIMNEQAKVFVQQLNKHVGGQVDFFPKVNLFALDTVCECACGQNLQAQIKDSEYVKAVKEMTILLTTRSFDITKNIDFIYQFSDMFVREKELLKILHDFTDGVIQRRSEDLMKKQNETTDEVNDDFGRKKKMALLDILLSSTIDGKPLTNFDIREEIDTFMFAGHDTTTCAISFTFHQIAKYPEVQQKVYEEIVEVLGENGDELTIPKLNNLSYLDLVIKETLRMYPPVPYYGRKLAEDLTVQGYTFPKDMNIYVSPFLMGRSEEYYDDPLTFKPERFNTETTYDKINPFAFVPFSAGPRNCIGQKFAQTELKIIISRVLLKYKLSLPPSHYDLSITSEVVLRPVDGIVIKVENRR